ncbi:MAG: hypothetical protein ABSA75_13470 [Candidatus Bathyarchaeia archaeon]
MGSQYIVDTKFGSVLGHPYNPDQMKIGYTIDQIAGVSMGVSTAKTKLGGSQIYGTGADYIIPTFAKAIVGVRPKLYLTTPTVNQSCVATLKIESQDLGMKDFEVFANPIDSALGATFVQMQDAAPWYPLMQPCNGGERMQFYGTPQIANAAAPIMELDILLADTYPEGYSGSSWGLNPLSQVTYAPAQGKVAGINYGGGPTSTGTAAATPVPDAGVNISVPKKRIIGLYGVVVESTPATVKPVAGQFSTNASEFVINPPRWNAEPITGQLGATVVGSLAHISACAPLNLGLRAPSTPKGTFTLDAALTTAANFEVGYLYMDYP